VKIYTNFFPDDYLLQLLAELGDEAWGIPLSLNIMGVAIKES